MKNSRFILCMLAGVFAVNAAAQTEPVSVVHLVHLARQALADNHIDEAIAHAQSAVEQDPAYAEAWAALGFAFAKMTNDADAVKALDTALRLTPDNADAWRVLAAGQWRMGRSNDAVNSLARYLRLKPDDAVAWRDQGVWLIRLDRKQEALPALTYAVEQKPDEAAFWRQLGQLQLQLNMPDQARISFEKTLALDKKDAVAWREVGWLQWNAGERDVALESLITACVEGAPNKDALLLQVVGRLAEEGNRDEALSFYHRATGGSGSPGTLGVELVRRGRLRAAEPLFAESWKNGDRSPAITIYLAYVKAVNGQCDAVTEQLDTLPHDSLKELPDEEIELLLETLRLCSQNDQLTPILKQTEAALKQRGVYNTQITEIIEKAAQERRYQGDLETALFLYTRVWERDPNRLSWIEAYHVMNTLDGPEAALQAVRALRERASAPAVVSALDGLLAHQLGNEKQASANWLESLTIEPDQPGLQRWLFDLHIRQGELDRASAVADWFAEQVELGRGELRSDAAEMRTSLRQMDKALDQWEMLHLNVPSTPYYGIEAANALLEMCMPDEARDMLLNQLAYVQHPQIYEMLAEIEVALGRPEEAARWAAEGLALQPTQGLRRYRAETLEMLGTNQNEILELSDAFLQTDPGHAPLSMLKGRTLAMLTRTNEARAHYEGLLARNAFFEPSMIFLRDALTLQGDFRAALDYARLRAELAPGSLVAQRNLANSLAQYDRFVSAIRAMKRIATHEPEDAVPVLVYEVNSECDYPARMSASKVIAHLGRLRDLGYQPAGCEVLTAHKPDTHSAVVVIVDADEDAVTLLDADLRANGGQLVYAASDEGLTRARPGKPSPERLRSLVASGRWSLASAGPRDTRMTVDATGVRGNPLTHTLFHKGEAESVDAMKLRIEETLMKNAGDARLLVLPNGDFGQISLDTDAYQLAALHSAVKAVHDKALYDDDGGFVLTGEKSLLLPALWVPAGWTTARLQAHLTQNHPVARARLELAKILYWNRQHEKADYWFAKAENAGADRQEVLFNWAASARLQGDYRTALRRFKEGIDAYPDDPRMQLEFQKTRLAMRPEAMIHTGGWQDNEDRSYDYWGGSIDGFVGSGLKIGTFGSRNRWETEGVGEEEGTRYGLRLQTFLAREIWFEGSVWELNMDEVEDYTGGRANLRLPNRWLSGFLNLEYRRDEIETVEALRTNLYTDTYALRTYSRLWNVFDLFADGNYLSRNDGNDTWLVDGRLVYRIKEWPYLGAGYRLKFGDSDFDPDEYWAPEELEQHQLYANLRGTYRRLNGSLSGEAGYAREADSDWRFVWGCRAQGSLRIWRELRLAGDIYYNESPDYNRTTWRVALEAQF